jgi:hypothetical protein
VEEEKIKRRNYERRKKGRRKKGGRKGKKGNLHFIV